MNRIIRSVIAEWFKIRRSPILWVTFVAFALGPLMGGLIMYLIANADPTLEGGMLMEKAKVMSFEADWTSYLAVLSQVVGVGGVLVFGFVASWIFGREYSDKTAKDLLALPTSRSTILNAKFILYLIWCLALIVSNLVLGIIIGEVLGLGPLFIPGEMLLNYIETAQLVILLGTPIAFFALWGQGYLAPLAFVVLTLVFSQIIGAIGYGHYFPWALPGLFSGAAGAYRERINLASYMILAVVVLAGFFATHFYWNQADQHG